MFIATGGFRIAYLGLNRYTPTHMTPPKIIGLSGTFASGKDTLAHYLVETFGYMHVSTGDMVRQEAMRLRGSIERPVLHVVATELRENQGAGDFAEQALKQLQEHPKVKGVVVTGLRSLGEAKEITKAGGVILFVDAAIERRYQRMVGRERDQETRISLEDFKANEAGEWYGGPKDTDFNMRDIKKSADIVIENNANLETFLQTARQKLGLTQ